jgi:nucleoside-diphosphate-sugar epimerase
MTDRPVATAEPHVVFGAGQVGAMLARQLLSSGTPVRIARRAAGAPQGAELMQGDAADPEFCIRAAAGASTVYHCMNPPYDSKVWAALLPRFMDNLIAAASRSGARLVVLDNLYMLGRPAGRPLTEDTPSNPVSRKGEIRAKCADRLFEAHRRGDIRAVSGRASDYYGPGGVQTHLGERFWRPALAGKTARMLIDPDAIHSYHYIPDVVSGLATLGTATDDVTGQTWMLPCAPAGTLRELVHGFAEASGRPIRVAGIPRLVVKALALFNPLVREVDEMLYQWEEPFIVDDRRFRERFGVTPVPADEAAVETVRWATSTYASR